MIAKPERLKLQTLALKEFVSKVNQEILQFMKNKNDECNAVLTVSQGYGGTEAVLFVDALLNMYRRFCENAGFEVKSTIISSTPCEAEIAIKGHFAYGLLQSEEGIHSIARISNFTGRRERAFCTVRVRPEGIAEVPAKAASYPTQMRNYVLSPYKLAQDVRTGFQTEDVQDILDGDLEEIITSYLKAL